MYWFCEVFNVFKFCMIHKYEAIGEEENDIPPVNGHSPLKSL